MIIVEDLTRFFNSHPAVDHLNFNVPQSLIFGLLGPNGAGKSTTIKMLTTLMPPSSGSASIGGYNIVTQPSKVRAQIGYVPQLVSADSELTGYENLLLSAKLYGISQHVRDQRIEDLLKFMGLTASADMRVNQYSGGMIRRLEIAQAMLHRPAVLFLDEPTIGLDPSARKLVWELVLSLRKEYGTTILISTHDMEEAEHLCDVIGFMNQGCLVAQGVPKEMKAELGSKATLNDVFIHFTGGTMTERGDYAQAAETRRTIHHLD
jgi:ABC-2 type transport system ATP-binding protein